jgi:hypothetical protein
LVGSLQPVPLDPELPPILEAEEELVLLPVVFDPLLADVLEAVDADEAVDVIELVDPVELVIEPDVLELEPSEDVAAPEELAVFDVAVVAVEFVEVVPEPAEETDAVEPEVVKGDPASTRWMQTLS